MTIGQRREKIVEIIKNGVTYSAQLDMVVIHGAIDELDELLKSERSETIHEAIDRLNSPLLNFSDGLIYKETVIEILNSLKI